jgi:transposase
MDGKLWKVLYREIHKASKGFNISPRVGRPVMYQTEEILAVWAFAALMDWPISVAQRRLSRGAVGWWLRRHWGWRDRIPSVPTLCRRAQQTEFRKLLRQVLHNFRRRLSAKPAAHVMMDSTFLLTGANSHDPESRWACHGGKWFRGYALHTICDEQGQLWAWRVTSANVQEMKAARKLIRQLAALNDGTVKVVIADSGYDSEPLHQLVRHRLDAMMLAPLNLRGSRTNNWRARQPGRNFSDILLRRRKGQMLLEKRSVVERWYSMFKGSSNVSSLPYHARRLHRVRRWIDLKLMVFFAHQYLMQKDLRKIA